MSMNTSHSIEVSVRFKNQDRYDQLCCDARATALAITAMASVPTLAILTLALFIGRSVWRFLG
jgi:hypothetical protein